MFLSELKACWPVQDLELIRLALHRLLEAYRLASRETYSFAQLLLSVITTEVRQLSRVC